VDGTRSLQFDQVKRLIEPNFEIFH